MSYDLTVWEGNIPSNQLEGTLTYGKISDILEGDDAQLEATPRIRSYVQALLARYPDPDVNDENFEDSWVWSTAPLADTADGTWLYFGMSYSAIEEVVPFCVKVAAEHNLTCFDPQTEKLLAVERQDPASPALKLFSDTGAEHHNPSSVQIVEELQKLNKRNKWLVLDRLDVDSVYIQTYRHGKNRWDLEYRQGTPEEHYVVTLKTMEEVAAAFRSWMVGDPSWKDLQWQPWEGGL